MIRWFNCRSRGFRDDAKFKGKKVLVSLCDCCLHKDLSVLLSFLFFYSINMSRGEQDRLPGETSASASYEEFR